MPLGQKITTQENCKQDRNSLAKSVKKEKKVFKKPLVKVRYFLINSMLLGFFVRKNDKGKLQIKRGGHLIHMEAI